jgi:hypothetical protein
MTALLVTDNCLCWQSEGKYIVIVDGRYGLIDASSTERSQQITVMVEEFADSLALVRECIPADRAAIAIAWSTTGDASEKTGS